MSPFSTIFNRIRLSRRMSQRELAEKMGYEQSYVSAMERSHKGPPPPEFLEKMAFVLQLTEEEQREVMDGVRLSQRKFMLATDASEETYRLVHEFWSNLETMHPQQIKAIHSILKIPAMTSEHPNSTVSMTVI